jgi:MoxR-like ATPase
MSTAHYIPCRDLELVARSYSRPTHRARAALFLGPPGSGKTSATEWLAERLGATYFYHLLHSWTDDQELFHGIDVAAAVAGEAQHVRQPGILAQAAMASASGPVVLALDEIDKTAERVEYLLLDYLQFGRVPVRPGEHIQANLGNLVVCLTTNGERDLSAPLLRRVRRVPIRPLAGDQLVTALAQHSGTTAPFAEALIRAARAATNPMPTLAELIDAAAEIWAADTYDDALRLAGHCLRHDGQPFPRDALAAAWGHRERTRRQADGLLR